MATNYNINYNDERFKQVEAEKQDKLNEINETYDNMVNQSDQFYQRQIDAAKEYATTQQDLQNQQTEQTINEINQQKERAEQDYLREQRGAYSDWQKQSNRYGANAEQMAANGLRGTGYSESSQVSMYNTYQNRVATAKNSYNQAVQNYDNNITQARLANSSRLAEIAYNALQTELELSLNGFQYKNQLLQTKLNTGLEVDNNYYNRWQNVLSQMNTENALKEQIRQYNENLKFQKKQAKQQQKNWQKEYELSKKAYRTSSSRGGSSGNNNSGKNKDKDVTFDKDKEAEEITLSDNGQKMLNKIKSEYLDKKGKITNKDKVIELLHMSLGAGAISKKDVTNIGKYFGLN